MSRPGDDEREFQQEIKNESRREYLRQQAENALIEHWERAIGDTE